MTRSGSMACRDLRSVARDPGHDRGRRQGPVHRLPRAHRPGAHRADGGAPECPSEQFILVTPGGGGDGAELVDWVISAYEHDPGLPHQAVLLMGPFMPAEQRAAFQERARSDRAADRRSLSRRGSSRCSSAPAPSSPWAATTRSARSCRSASRPCWCRAPRRGWSSISAPSAPQKLGLVRMLPNDGVRATGADGGCPARAAVRCRCRRASVRGPMLEGSDRIDRLIAPWLEPARPGARSAPQPLRVAGLGQPRRHPGQGLSAPVRDLHRPGDPGAGAAAADARDRLPAPSDRPAGTCAAPTRSGRPSATCRSICTRSRYGCYAALAGSVPQRRFWRLLADLARRPAARPRRANRGRRLGQALVLAAELPAEVELAARALPAHAGFGRALHRHPARPAVQHLGARQGRLDHPGLGEAREARRGAMAGHLQPDEPRPSARAGAAGRPGAGLSRPRSRAVSGSAPREPGGDGIDPARPVTILSVARAVEKKGLDVLLEALARLAARAALAVRACRRRPAGAHARSARPSALGIADRVTWRGRGHAGRGAGGVAPRRPVLPGGPHRRRRRPGRPAQRDHGGDVAGAARGRDRGRRHRRGRGPTARPACWCRRTIPGAWRCARGADPRARRSAQAHGQRRAAAASSSISRWRPGSPGSPGASASCRGARGRLMRVAFYAPMKPPDHPVALGRPAHGAGLARPPHRPRARGRAGLPSPQLRPARAIRAGSSGSPTWAPGSPRPRPALPARGRRSSGPALVHLSPLPQGARLAGARREPGAGDPLCRGRGVGRRQAGRRAMVGRLRGKPGRGRAGQSGAGHDCSRSARFGRGRERARPVGPFPPFLDARPFVVASEGRAAARARLGAAWGLDVQRPWLLAVAMMRADVKLLSYRLLAAALREVDRPRLAASYRRRRRGTRARSRH